MIIKRKTLKNGLRIIGNENPNTRAVSIGIWIKGGSIDEKTHNNGMGHFIEHMLFKGTHHMTSKDIAFKIDSMGGEMNAFTSKECTSIFSEVLDENLEDTLSIMSDMLIHSKFDEDEINKEKTVIIDEILLYEDSPEDIVDDMLCEVVYKNSALSLPIAGNIQTVEGFTREGLVQHFERFYNPKNMVVAISGNCDFDKTSKHIEKLFKFKNHFDENVNTEVDIFNEGFSHRRKNFELNHFSIAFKGIKYSDPRLYAFLILSTIIGGSVSSRMFQKIREDAGLTYTIESAPVFYSDTGILNIYFTTVNDNIEKLREVLINELIEIKQGKFDDEELIRAKKQMRSGYLLGTETASDIMNILGKSELFYDEIKDKDEILHLIERVTIKDLKELSSFIFDGAVAMSVVGKITKSEALKFYRSIKNGLLR